MLFYKNYIVYQNVYMFVLSELEVAITSPSFVTLYLMVSEIAKLHCLRLFTVVLQELHCLLSCLHVFMIRVIGCYYVTKFRYSTPSGFLDS